MELPNRISSGSISYDFGIWEDAPTLRRKQYAQALTRLSTWRGEDDMGVLDRALGSAGIIYNDEVRFKVAAEC